MIMIEDAARYEAWNRYVAYCRRTGKNDHGHDIPFDYAWIEATKQLQAENERLKKLVMEHIGRRATSEKEFISKIEKLENSRDFCAKANSEIIANHVQAREQLQEKLKLAVDALKFYGDRANWQSLPANPHPECMGFYECCFEQYGGKLARETLAKLKESK